jgi:hypothetical protein
MFYGNPNATDNQNPDGVWGGYGMVHHLEESSSTAIDSSLNGNHGTYTGSNQGINGVIDGGYGFLQGESMEVSHSLSIDPGSGEFSISLWADLPSSNNGTIIKKWYETYGIGYKLFINEENELEFLIDDNDDNATKNSLLDIVDEAESLYLSNERISAHNRLLELRARLNPDSDESVVEPGVETGGILYKIDRILDQLRPKIRVIARDQRGITVSAYAELTTSTEDVYGPKINNADVQPLQCEQDEIVTLEAQADDRWYGNSSITAVEYFISSTMPVGQNGMGINMTSIDGSFDESIEDVIANFSSNDLTPGDNYIWIHSKDSEGNWGYFTMLHVELILNNVLHIQSVDITGYQSGWFLKRYYAIAKVTVVDGQGTPVEDVTVEGAWSGDVSGTDTRITGPSGECSFTSSSKYVWFGGNDYEFTFTANSASKLDYTWDGIVVTETLYYP